MTDNREKLIKLLLKAGVGHDRLRAGHIADFLIENGVTFATDTNVGSKWIPVTERLPERKQDVLMCFDTGNMAVGWWYDRDEVITFWSAYSDDGWYTDCDCEPLYWMPLPEAPKEE